MKPVEGAIAAGATRWEMIRYAVVPQVLSNFASYGLLRFEINVRGASVMGFVGAGGIGSGSHRGDPQVLLFRCLAIPAADHRDSDGDRPRYGTHSP